MADYILLGNLKLLKGDMEDKGWTISSFLFNYKQQGYITLVKLYESGEKKPQYALVKIEFFKQDNLNDSLMTPANSAGLMIDAKMIREYFGIEYRENFGDIIKQFYNHLAIFIPKEVNDNINEVQRDLLVKSLSKSDSENPNRKYCFKVRRNPMNSKNKLGQRSIYNDNKTRLLRKDLYEKLKSDSNLSFCFSENPEDEKSDVEIIYNWAKNQN